MRTFKPIHPGEILFEEFMEPLSLSANRLADEIKVPTNRITTIIKGNRSVTGDTALRLAEAFGTSPEFWMNLQSQYDLETAEMLKGVEIRKRVRRIKEAKKATGVAAEAAA